MKTNILYLLLIATLFGSCASYYQFYQVYQVKPEDESIRHKDGNLVYEDEHCSVVYNFWQEKGNAGFTVYNKTDDIMYIDLSKSFYLKNGKAYDYYLNREWNDRYVQTINSSVTLFSYSSLDKHTTTTTIEKPVVAIPPHANKSISEYIIHDHRILDCDLIQYPTDSASVACQENNPSITFGNDITYTIGNDSTIYTIQNRFYVASIANYAEPSFWNFKERKEPCENMKRIDQPTHMKLYDRYCIKHNGSSFYLPYKVLSRKTLYRTTQYFYWSEYWQCWTGNGGN